MYRCKHARKHTLSKTISNKLLISLLAVALVCCVSISSTLAWMVDRTNPVVNTFTYGDINITLTESGAVDGSNTYDMAPGISLAKDPTVTVGAGSEDCWLFVTLEESDNFKQYLSYGIAEGWSNLSQQSTSGSSIYYRAVAHNDASDQTFAVLDNNMVYVHHSVTKEMLNTLTAPNYPFLTVTAYAVQQEGITDADSAWELIE